MLGFSLLDVILVVALIVYTIVGLRNGLLLSLGGLVGIAAGAVAAFFVVPFVNTAITDGVWRIPAVIAATIVLILVGHALGSLLGRILRRGVDYTPLRLLDRIAGGAINLVVGALLMSVLAFGIGSLGVPSVSTAIASSTVITSVDDLTPGPVKSVIAQLRGLVVQDGTTRFIQTINPGVQPSPPQAQTDTPALHAAAQSVLKVSGTAYACGQTQSGSGFVVAPGRVVTNAHVVAGIGELVVQSQDGKAWTGRVVYFDPTHDLAVIAVDDLPTPALRLASNLAIGDSGVFDGYPLGGPFQSNAASVDAVPTVNLADIYGQKSSPMQIYDLAANVQKGNSGGPLLNSAGRVAGVIFAKSTSDQPVGYALTMQELSPVATKAESLTQPVASGHCTKE